MKTEKFFVCRMGRVLSFLMFFLIFSFGEFCKVYAQNGISQVKQGAVTLEGIEFVEKDYGEIFYSLSLFTGVSISADDTVRGKGTFRYAGENFESAFDSFLKAERMFVNKSDGKWNVSKVHFSEDEEEIVLEAFDVKPSRIVEKISLKFGIEVTYDMLLENEVSLYCRGTEGKDFLMSLCRQLGSGYELEADGKIFHIGFKKSESDNYAYSNYVSNYSGTCNISKLNGLYSAEIIDAQVLNVVEDLFRTEAMDYVLSSDSSGFIKRMNVKEKSFDEILCLVCNASGMEFVEENEIVYLFNSSKQGRGVFGVGRKWKVHEVSFAETEKVLSVLNGVIGSFDVVVLPGNKGFISFETEEEGFVIDDIVKSLDVKSEYYTVAFKYIKTSDFLTHLPPGFSSEEFKPSTKDNCLYFTGSSEKFAELMDSLPEIDCPVKRVSYDLLVLQYQYTGEDTWEAKLGASRIGLSDTTNIFVNLGSVLGLNFDVVSTFGYKFAASLQAAINENKAHIYADTKLHGVSGGTINFQNTNTYRYRDNNLDPETGKPLYTGVTREIVSGLKIDVSGWVSGDGMITTSITASISRQGMDLSSKNGNPPSSTEKVVTTEVRGKSGEPIVLSGLVQDDSENVEAGVPFLSKIPLLGWLFKSSKKNDEKSEMIIYLVPHWERDDLDESDATVTGEIDVVGETDNGVVKETVIGTVDGVVETGLIVAGASEDMTVIMDDCEIDCAEFDVRVNEDE